MKAARIHYNDSVHFHTNPISPAFGGKKLIHTAVLFGFTLDGFMLLAALIPREYLAVRIISFALGMFFCSLGVSFMFHTYITPQVYELFVKEVSAQFHLNINKCKICFDISCAAVGLILSFSFFGFGSFVGVKIGTLICTFLNGPLIALFSKIMEQHFEFRDLLPIRRHFE